MRERPSPIPNARRPVRLLAGACALLVPLLIGAAAIAQTSGGNAGARPDSTVRFVSLRASKAYLRKGPGTGYPIARVYEQAGLPVEVIREFDVWRQVRDAQGLVGWLHSSLLSVRRTALVLPWETQAAEGQPAPTVPVQAALRDDADTGAGMVAQIAAGTLVRILGCEHGWCRIAAGRQRGYMEQTKLWGTYPNETVR